MKIAIVGAGAMGSLFGGRLAAAGAEVVLLDTAQAQIDAVNRDGLRLATDEGERVVRLTAGRAAEIAGAHDLVVIFTKGMHTDAAVASAAHLIGPETRVLTLQNGLGNVEVIARRVPRDRILFGMTNYPADLKAPGHVASHGGGEVRLWSAAGRPDERLEAVRGQLEAAGFVCIADPMVEIAVWEKVAFNAALNAMAAVTRLAVGAMGDRAAGRRLAQTVVTEALAVARARGVAVDEHRVEAAVSHAFSTHRAHLPSMLQDVLAGRPTEIETINGAVIAAARELGMAAPATETLLELIRMIDPVTPAIG
jgi:2-dehydropantoate 2-reductase